jgi:hypothetical protein
MAPTLKRCHWEPYTCYYCGRWPCACFGHRTENKTAPFGAAPRIHLVPPAFTGLQIW